MTNSFTSVWTEPHFCQFIFVFLSLNISEYTSFIYFFICHFFIPVCFQWLHRAIHRPFFSRLASPQFADFITCITTNHFVLVWTDTAFSPVHSLNFEFQHACRCSVSIIYLPFLHPSVLLKSQQSNSLTKFQSPGWRTICLFNTYLVTSHFVFVSVWAQHCYSVSLLVSHRYRFFNSNMSEQISFRFMFHVPPSDSKAQQSHPPTHF